MPLTRPIPEECRPIIETIRRDVPRPKALPIRSGRQFGSVLRFSEFGNACPLGLLPDSTHATPYEITYLDPRYWDNGEIVQGLRPFIAWWDEQTDPQAAVDAVWGEA